MQNLQKTSKFYKIVFKIIFILIVISVPCFWAFAQQDYIPSIIDTAQLYIDEISHPLSLDTRIIGFLVSLIPVSVILYILALLIKLFANYERLEVFSYEVVSIYKRLGWGLVYYFIAQIIFEPLISLTLSYHNPVGERFFSLSIDTNEIVALLCGGVIITISKVMQKAHEIAEENDLTI
ncbi:DUF2975 domain-containing protein [Francisella tularensis]|uniref:DUF2975 domain-containing protein n=1 Tax=Francisella tularensis TaxID=263 RepID=UPI000173E580|nr:DUF2975 domain-containing protein [Francisella tularensis]ACD30873.1 hypothetical membrane protein [Francisella tularensis subsp. mediasiatica FSC147]MBK2077857.1 DUF2975 domain-containing protein [Francisella tularensis subsp. mediasiatica]MBK2101952.1 DUF2975 domain-containing protein [Francisella tularensis subsp. mediasiatica]MBK2103930.1 DUF2975 domain-containing protein [Francisella tularensis subsp. mediasiatica]MDN9003293.1 DUF2975 domain-containing protein [Francisella tularensis s